MYDNLQLERVLNDNDEKEDDLNQFISEIKSKHDISDTVNDDYIGLINPIVKDNPSYDELINCNNSNCNTKTTLDTDININIKIASDSQDNGKSDIKIKRNNMSDIESDNKILNSPTTNKENYHSDSKGEQLKDSHIEMDTDYDSKDNKSQKYIISISSLNSPEVSQELGGLISCKSNNTMMSKNTP